MKHIVRLQSPQEGGWTLQSEDRKSYIFCREMIIDKPTKTELFRNGDGKVVQGALCVDIDENQELKIINNILYIK